MRQLLREGVYTDRLTEEFMRDVVNSAPLHDVGKIQVSDAILNKPGKLTDEEFEIMKSHTTAGAQVIEHAMDIIREGAGSHFDPSVAAAFEHAEAEVRKVLSGRQGEEK